MRGSASKKSIRPVDSKKTKKKIVFIVGPTAIGKTEFACLLAKRLKGEVISCDSISIYKGMDIISSKPQKKIIKGIPYHLIDILSPGRQYNVARFIRQAKAKIKEILSRKKTPIIAGGSGLYIDGLLYGVFGPGRNDDGLRNRFNKAAVKYGKKYLHYKLRKLDPEAAEKIHPNNLRRVIRALEVCLLTRDKFSSLKQKRKGLMDDYNVMIFGLKLDRDRLYEKIDKRVDWMFQEGLVREVKGLLKNRLGKTAGQALGIKEIRGYLNGEYDLERAKYFLKRNTRHFAKRQITWFKRNKGIYWIDADLPARKMLDVINGAI